MPAIRVPIIFQNTTFLSQKPLFSHHSVPFQRHYTLSCTAPRCPLALSQLLLLAFVFTLLPLTFLFLLQLLPASIYPLL